MTRGKTLVYSSDKKTRVFIGMVAGTKKNIDVYAS